MSLSDSKKNDASWERLFEDHRIIGEVERKGLFEITSRQINRYRESRLMANFDHKSNLPKIFKRHGLSILPISRGTYVIGKFRAYRDVEYDKTVKNVGVDFPGGYETIDPRNIYSESAALNCAHLCGMMDDIMEEEAVLTISGRMSTSSFEFQIGRQGKAGLAISVKNSQCEIDGGYEGKGKLLLIEAKNTAPSDFLIRQLYYPYRLWSSRTGKDVIPAFMTYSNDVFTFFIYRFQKPTEYNSLSLVEQRNYVVAPEEIGLDEIADIADSVEIIQEPEVPFPQADSFARIVDLLGLLVASELSAADITTNYDFDKRQTDYYTSACRYLGLVERKRTESGTAYSLNRSGRGIMAQRHKKKSLLLVERILQHKVFYDALQLCLKRGEPPEREDVYKIMKSCGVYNVQQDSTLRRRAQTVIRWIDWILELQGP